MLHSPFKMTKKERETYNQRYYAERKELLKRRALERYHSLEAEKAIHIRLRRWSAGERSLKGPDWKIFKPTWAPEEHYNTFLRREYGLQA